MQRRSFIAGILGAAAAPAIVKADSLMKLWVPEKIIWHRRGIARNEAWCIEFDSPGGPIDDLTRMQLRALSESLGTPYLKIIKDFPNTDYVSVRLPLAETKAIWINPTTGKTEFFATPFSLPRPAWPADGLS